MHNKSIFKYVFILLLFCASAQAETPFENIVKYNEASVTISPSGCSGTLICPNTVLTAAHCIRSGAKTTVTFRSGKKAQGVVIFHKESDRDGIDMAIIRLSQKVTDIDYVPFADEYPPDKAEVLIYGRPAAAGYDEIKRFRGTVDLRGDGSWLDIVGETAAIGGDSGGGAFYDGKAFGINARCNSDWDRNIRFGNWTGVSETKQTFTLLRERPCNDPECKAPS